MGLVLDWQKKLGYSKDPFEGSFSPVTKFLVGLSPLQERLNLFLIKEERFGTIAGDKGTGKSLLLQWMNDELAPQKSHAQQLFDAKAVKREEIVTTLLASRLSLFERISKAPLKLPPQEREKELLQRLAKEQKNVLLVDNAGNLGKHELELLSDISSKTPTYVIFSDTEERLKKLSLPEPLIDKLKLKIPDYTIDDLTLMLRKRIESVGGVGTFPFEDAEIKSLIKKAEHNPARLLGFARERAIELSLKVKTPPKVAPVQSAPQEKSSFLSIKKVSVSQPDEEPAPAPVDKAALALPPDEAADAAKLANILSPSDGASSAPRRDEVMKVKAPDEKMENIVIEKPKGHKEHKTKHDKVVEKLVEEFSKKKKTKK